MRRPTTVELMLLTTIVLWALSLSASRYLLTHGLKPLTYSALRYGIGSVVFVTMVLVLERSVRIHRRHLPIACAAALVLLLNQVGFVYAIKLTSASVVALLLASTPVLTAVIGLGLGTDAVSRRFWLGAMLSLTGVAFVAFGGGGVVHGNLAGFGFAIVTVVSWAVYSVLITPLMGTYSPARISAVVVPLSTIGILIAAPSLTTGQSWDLGWAVWLLVAFAALGPLVVTNVLWFHALDRIGPSRATLAANLQPFLAAVFALVLLGESLGLAEIVGGLLIAVGIVAGRSRTPTPPVPVE
jgi:drug/metabolite transporter (DMT)-like permease